MKRKHIIYITFCQFVILLMTILTACSANAEDVATTDDTLAAAGEPVIFSMAFGNELTRTGTTIDNVWPANKMVTIANNASTVLKYNFTTGTTVTTNADGNTLLTPVGDNFIWPISNPEWSFSGWYPAGDNAPSGITVDDNQSSLSAADYEAYDLLYCPPTPVSFRQKPVALTFLHQMVRVVVIIGTDYTDTKEKVTKVEFGGDKVVLKGSISTLGTTLNTNGTTIWTASTENAYQNKTITMRANSDMTDAGNHVYAFECMLPPQTYLEGGNVVNVSNLIKITSEKNSPGTGTRFYHYDNTINLQAGYQYTYNLLISEQGVITLATVKVTDWTTGAPINNNAVIPTASYPDEAI